jgi:hypothetical protein
VDRPRLDDDVDVVVSQHLAKALGYLSEFKQSVFSVSSVVRI